jgi:UDP-N-acetylmuramoyl-L-alanyl-D-glutamate--2,6-diaminopimelate ligase
MAADPSAPKDASPAAALAAAPTGAAAAASAAAVADPAAVVAWLRSLVGPGAQLRVDSRALRPGDVFVALPGTRADGRAHIADAAGRGAAAVLVEAAGWVGLQGPAADLPPLRAVARLADRLGDIAAAFYGQPSERLLTVAVTGTNGKTSITQWIAQLFGRHGRHCGVIGTLGWGFPAAPLAEVGLTTPDAATLQRLVRDLLQAGARALALEVSSIGLDQGRVNGMQFDIAVFTNLTRDHLDYHRTMQAYEAAKVRLIDWPTLSTAVINLDDAAGRRCAARSIARGVRTIGFTVDGAGPVAPDVPTGLVALLRASAVRATAGGLHFDVVSSGPGVSTQAAHVAVPLVGHFNVANLLAVLGVAHAAGLPFAVVVAELAALVPPAGRMQSAGNGVGAPHVVVDYAHTPDAVAKALQALRPLAQARGGQLWVVLGAGGDRDPGKRAPMGAAAARFADRVVVTSDNPRTERPEAIVAAVLDGALAGAAADAAAVDAGEAQESAYAAAAAAVPADGAGGAAAPDRPSFVRAAASVESEIDRARAIAQVVQRAAVQDVVLIAGKGHEDTQEIDGRRLPFSDLAHARAALAARLAAPC